MNNHNGGEQTVPFMAHIDESNRLPAKLDFESLVDSYYAALYRFAYSLTHREADARDLTQQTYYIWAKKGHQLQDDSKVKSWLFTTLHREFLKTARRQARFPHQELDSAASELPPITPAITEKIDSETVLSSLDQLDDDYRTPLVLFYLQDFSYKEIAEMLQVPLGTVQSRMARGKAHLHQLLTTATGAERRG